VKKLPKRNKIIDEYIGISSFPPAEQITNLNTEQLFINVEEQQKKDLKSFLISKTLNYNKMEKKSGDNPLKLRLNKTEIEEFQKLTPLEHLIFAETIKYGETSSVNIVESTHKSKQLVSRVIRKLLRNNIITYMFTPIVNNIGLTMKLLHIKTKKNEEKPLILPNTDWIYAVWKNYPETADYFLFLTIPDTKESNQVLMRYINRLLGCKNVVDVEDYDLHDEEKLWDVYYNPSVINRKTLRYAPADYKENKIVKIEVPFKTNEVPDFSEEELEFASILQVHGNLPLRQLEEKTNLPYRKAKEIKEKVTKYLLKGWVSLGPAFNYTGVEYLFDYSTETYEELQELAKKVPKSVLTRIKGFQDLVLWFIRIHPMDIQELDQMINENDLIPEAKMKLESVIPGYLSYAFPLEHYNLEEKKWEFDFEKFLPLQS